MPQTHFTVWFYLRAIAYLVIGIVVAVAWFGRAGRNRKATPLNDGRLSFSPNRRALLAWLLIEGDLAWVAIYHWRHAHGNFDFATAALWTVLFGSLFVMVPETILVGPEGLEQVFWFSRNKRIRWGEIVEINTGEKSEMITIKSAKGTTIVHSKRLPDRERLLREISQHCGDELPSDFPRESTAGPELGNSSKFA